MQRPFSPFWQGFRDASPFVLVIVPFGAVFGVAATEAGLGLAEVMGFSILVIAGAAQFVALQMMIDNAPVLIVLAASLGVNLRMAMYSASLAPHLGPLPFWKRAFVGYLLTDQSFASMTLRLEQAPRLSLHDRWRYFLGVVIPVAVPWYLATWAGAVLGQAVPADLPIDFAVPITFLALILPMLRTLAHLGAALVSITGVLAFGFLPWNLGLLVSAVLAMATGAEIERRQTARQGARS